MPIATVSLSERAYAYALRKKTGKTRGIGKIISECLVAAEARELALEQVRQVLEGQPPLPSRQSWEQSGVRVY